MSNGRKEEILEKLKKLEEKHETGEIFDSRYRIRRIRLEEKLDVMSESDLGVNSPPQKTADEETNDSWKI